MSFLRPIVASTLVAAILTACAATDATAPAIGDASLASGGAGGTATTTAVGTIVVKCELRAGSGARSKVSVDGRNLTPANGRWSARVSSGTGSASAPIATAVGDEVEFDFSSQPNDIAAGAVAIARGFVVVNAAGPDVRASILDAAGNVVLSGGADCRTR